MNKLQNECTLGDIRYMMEYFYEPTKVDIRYYHGYRHDDYFQLYDGDGTEIPYDLWDFRVMYGDGINVERGTMYISVDSNDDDVLEYIGAFDDIEESYSRKRAKLNLRNKRK